jgi:hypothetical protein
MLLMKLVSLVSLATLAALALGGSVSAHTRQIADPDEGHFIDIEAVEQGHPGEVRFRNHLVSFDIDTYQTFANSDLQLVEDYEAIAIGISVDHDDAFERLIAVKAEPDAEAASGYAPYAIVTGGKRQQDADLSSFTARRNLIGYGRVSRPTEDGIEIIVPEHMLEAGGLDRFRWQLRFVSSEPGQVDFDYVPNLKQARGHTSE